MSLEESRIAPGFGALLVGEIGGAQPATFAKSTSSSRLHAIRYGYGFTTPS